MKKSLFLKLTILLLIISTLSGCLLVDRNDGYRRGGVSHENDRGHDQGNHRGERPDRH